MKNNNIINLK